MLKKVLLSLLVLYTILGFIIVPMVVKPKVIEIANQQLNAKLSVDSIYLNPFIFILELSGVKLKDLDGKHLVSFKSLDVDVELYSLFVSALHVKSVKIDKPKISLIYNKDKTINLATILKPQEQTPIKKESKEKIQLPRIIVDKISIQNGGIDYEDYTREKEYSLSLKRLSFKLENIDTNNFDTSGGTIRFHTDLGESGLLDLRAKVKGLKPLKIEGNIDFEETKLYEELDYIDNKLGIEVANGSILFHADYAVNLDKLDDTLIDNITLSLKDIRVKPKDENHDVLNLKSFDVSGAKVQPFKEDVHVDSVSLDSLHVKARRDKNGDIDWSKWFVAKKTKDDENIKKPDENLDENSSDWNVVVDKIALAKIALDVDDSSVSPSVQTKLNELNINLKDITLAGEKPFVFDMNLLLNNKFKCNANGDVKHKILEVNSYLACKDFDIVHYRPYIDQIANNELKTYDILLSSANASFDVNASLKDENSKINTVVNSANFSLDKLLLKKKSTGKKLAGFKSFKIKEIHVETKSKKVNVSKIALNGLKIDAEKNKDGSINFDGLVEPKESKKTKTKAKKTNEKPYRVKLKHFNLNKAQVNFNDKSIQSTTNSKIDKITLNAYNIDSKKNSWLKYKMYMRINDGGNISSKGSIRHTPLKQKGSLSIDKISLKEITPYLQESLFVDLKDGFVSLDTKLSYEKNEKNPDLHVDGNVKIESIELTDSRDNETLLAFAKTDVKSFNLELFPSSLFINEVALDSFYVDAQIDKNKVMNFAKLSKTKEDSNATVEPEKKEEFPLKIMKLHVSNGTANFADYSLPIDFKTSMHDLNGNVFAISNSKEEISYINIDGEVDKYGSTKISGSIETGNIKAYTDMSVSFRNLALNSYSGYSAQFAGHKIEKGKLFLDLGYKILNSELLGKNSLIIKSIELGDEIEDENITSLPLGFAIALLEDSDGVIDINMPVEGNLDEPDFKYGALLLKTFANLIVKAVASPFNFLGEAMGFNGDDLKAIDFEPGKFAVLPPEREKLDNIAKMLVKKPKLSFSIAGSYDKAIDEKAFKVAQLTTEVLKQSEDKKNKVVMTADILEKIYTKSVGKPILEALKIDMQKKYKDETKFNVAYQEVLLKKCIDIQVIDEKELKSLADKRAAMIHDYLVQSKNIQANRVILDEQIVVSSEDEKWIQTPLQIVVK